MQNRNLSLISLKTSKWPCVIAWLFYSLCLLVCLTLSLDMRYKLLIIMFISLYFWWWQKKILSAWVTQIALLDQQNWSLRMQTGEEVEASLKHYVKLGGWVLLYFTETESRKYNVLITTTTVSKDTFRRLLVNLNYS